MAVVLRCLSGKNITIIVWHIKNGVFVSPSRMEAESYGIRDKIHTKRVALTDVAWIDSGQGQYAKVDDAKISTKDSEGKTLTPEQQEYFKNSKVRDAKGDLLVMYHGGADETYTVFDRKKSKYSNLYGRGFYFTSAKTHSSQYGTVRSFYLNIKNPLSNDETTIKKSDLLKFIKAVAENDDYGIEDYGYGATPESVTDAVYGKSDFAMLQDINASCIGDMVEAVEYFNSVIGTDYDGFILPTETVAFDSAQIKNIDNTNPTDSEDVRYSLKDTARDDVHKALTDIKYREDVQLTEHSPSIITSQNGAKDLPMVMKASHIRENILTEEEAKRLGLVVDEHTHYHGLGDTLFLNVMNDLENVTLAYRGTKNAQNTSRRENYFLLISQHRDAKGNTINVPVYINERGQVNRVIFGVNKVATAFGRDDFFNYIKKEIANGNLVKIKNRRVNDSERTADNAGGYIKNSSTEKNIPPSNPNVNTEDKSSLKDDYVIDNNKETPRDILLSTFSGLAQNEIEQKYLDDYRKNITELV